MSLHGELDHELLPPATAIWSLVAHEELSRPFSVTVTFPTTEPDVDLAGMLGKPITVRLFDPERLALPGGMRLFHGVVSQARFVHQRGDRFVHAVQIRPQLALLEHRVATRIFQDKSTFTIVKEVLTRAGLREDLFSFPDDPHPPRLFSLQWKESDLAFVSRLLEDEGIFYFTAHQTDGELTVFGDEDTVFKPISGDPTITLTERPSPLVTSDWITDVSLEARAAHDAYLARGWDCFTPQVPTEAKSGFPDPIAERYEFRRSFDFQIDATRKADRRLSALRARRIVLRGRSNSLRLTPGRTFDVDGAASPGANQSYRVLAAHTHFTSPEAAGGAARFRVDVEAMPAGTNYRPPLVTPRPRVYGKQSAVVVGDPGEEIHVDEWGRIRVRFYWDREAGTDASASCWMRVQQQNLQSAMILPRVGWEMEVGFEEGDPDRPVILNKLYNGETAPPYALPDSLAQSALQSSSTPGGGGTNEMRMDDTNGNQQWFLHAQKDLSIDVGNDMFEDVAVNASVQVGADASEKILGNDTRDLGVNQSVSVTGAIQSKTDGNRSITVSAMDELGVGALYTATTKSARTEDVGSIRNVLASRVTETFQAGHERRIGGAFATAATGPLAEVVKGTKTELVGGAKIVAVSKAHQESIGTGKVLTAGSVQTKSGKDIALTGGAGIATITGGPMAIKCKGDFGITGDTVIITVGQADLKAGARVKMAPAKAQLQASNIQGDSVSIALKGMIDYE